MARPQGSSRFVSKLQGCGIVAGLPGFSRFWPGRRVCTLALPYAVLGNTIRAVRKARPPAFFMRLGGPRLCRQLRVARALRDPPGLSLSAVWGAPSVSIARSCCSHVKKERMGPCIYWPQVRQMWKRQLFLLAPLSSHARGGAVFNGRFILDPSGVGSTRFALVFGPDTCALRAGTSPQHTMCRRVTLFADAFV